MKIRLLFLFSLIVAIVGCNSIKDATTLPIKTTLQISIPVNVVDPSISVVATSPSSMKVAVSPISFADTVDLILSNNTQLVDYKDKIKQINIDSLVITVTGLNEGQTINSVSLKVTNINNVASIGIFDKTNITSVNNSFKPNIPPGILDLVAAKLEADKQIRLIVYGEVSGPMAFNVGISLASRVIVYTIY